jgi:hypothetical protein
MDTASLVVWKSSCATSVVVVVSAAATKRVRRQREGAKQAATEIDA